MTASLEAVARGLRELELADQRLRRSQEALDRRLAQVERRATLDPLGRPSLSAILRAVTTEFQVPLGDLLSDRRAPRVALARHVTMHLARELTPLSLSVIGRLLGRDHTTVLHGVDRIGALLRTDPVLAARVEAVAERLLASAQITEPERAEA